MNDRLKDLGKLPTWADEEGQLSSSMQADGDENAYNRLEESIEMTKSSSNSRVNTMKIFYEEVDEVRRNINTVVNATDQIDNLNDQLLSATTEKQEKELAFQLRIVVDEANKSAKSAKNALDRLKKENADPETKNKINDTDLRVRGNVCATLLRKFVEEMKQYQKAQFKYKTDLKTKAKRQIKIFKEDVTDEEVDEIIQGGGRQQYFQQQILAGGVNDDIKTMHAQVTGKYEDIVKIEKSIKELAQMFYDMAVLTDQQGELLDQISFNVQNAVDYTDAGCENLVKGLDYAKEARKKEMMIVGIVVVIIVILCFVIF